MSLPSPGRWWPCWMWSCRREGSGAGIVGGFRRVLGGESFLVNRFTGGPEGGWVMAGAAGPGGIFRSADCFPTLICSSQKGAFLRQLGSRRAEFQVPGVPWRPQRGGPLLPAGLCGEVPGDGVFPFLRSAAGRSPWSLAGSWWWILGIWWPSPEAWDYSVRKVGGGIRSMIGSGEGAGDGAERQWLGLGADPEPGFLDLLDEIPSQGFR